MQSYSLSPTRSRIQNIQNPYPSSMNSYPSSSQKPFMSNNYHSNDMKSFSSPFKHENDPQQEQILRQNLNIKQNVSFARNYKARLYGADPKQEQSKQRVQQQYRIELKRQIDEDRRRRQQQIAKEKAEDQKLERKFYQNMHIEAQTKADKKQEPSYFVVRSSKGKRTKLPKRKGNDNHDQSILVNNFLQNSKLFNQNDDVEQPEKKTVGNVQKIAKRGGYHNKSWLDNQQNNQPNQEQLQQLRLSKHQPNKQGLHSLPDEYMNEINYEQQRISRLMLSQQNMLRKLDNFKREIMETNKALQLDQELQKVRFKLRAKPLNMEKLHSLHPKDGLDDMILNNSEFYHLPMISKNHKIYQGEREHKKNRDRQQKLMEEQSQTSKRIHQDANQQPKELVQLHDKTPANDKNIANPQQVQPAH